MGAQEASDGSQPHPGAQMPPVQADRDPREEEAVASEAEEEPSHSVRAEGSEDDGEDLMDNMEA